MHTLGVVGYRDTFMAYWLVGNGYPTLRRGLKSSFQGIKLWNRDKEKDKTNGDGYCRVGAGMRSGRLDAKDVDGLIEHLVHRSRGL